MIYGIITTICYVVIVLLAIGASVCFFVEKTKLSIILAILLIMFVICYCAIDKIQEIKNPIYYYISVDGVDYVCDNYEITDTTIKLYIDDDTTIVLMLHYDSEIVIKKGD